MTSVVVAAEQLRRAVPGGIGRAAAELLEALRRTGDAEVTVWASRSKERPDPLGRFGWPLRTTPLDSRLLVAAWGLGLGGPPRGFDVVHAVSLAAPPARGVPLTVTVHDLAWRQVPSSTTPRGRRWHEAALGRALGRATRLIAPSSKVAEDLIEAGADPGRIRVIPWGVDHLAAPDVRGAEALLARHGVEGPFLLSVGTLEPRKNLAVLLEAFERARPQLPEGCRLVVVGPAGWGAAAPGRGPAVAWAGAVSEPVLSALYRLARAFAYVPVAEGFGFPALEAASVGLPCVVSSAVPSLTGAAPETVAVEVEASDPAAVASGLLAAVNDEALRRRVGQGGRAHAASYTWAACAEAYAEVWREVA